MPLGDPVFFAIGSGIFDSFIRGRDSALRKRSADQQFRLGELNINQFLPASIEEIKSSTALTKAREKEIAGNAELVNIVLEKIKAREAERLTGEQQFREEFNAFVSLQEQKGGLSVQGRQFEVIPERARAELERRYIQARSDGGDQDAALQKLNQFMDSIPEDSLPELPATPEPPIPNRSDTSAGPFSGIADFGNMVAGQNAAVASSIGRGFSAFASEVGGVARETFPFSTQISPEAQRLISQGAARNGSKVRSLNPAFSGLLTPGAEELILRR